MTLYLDCNREPISVCVLPNELSCQPLSILPSVETLKLTSIATKSPRNHCHREFTESIIKWILHDKIIQESRSGWYVQSFVVSRGDKLSLIVNYFNTINRFNLIDTNLTANRRCIRKNYIQSLLLCYRLERYLPSNPNTRRGFSCVGFEACNKLFEFIRLPFRCTNAVTTFQRIMGSLIHHNSLQKTYRYIDDIMVWDETKEHSHNLTKF